MLDAHVLLAALPVAVYTTDGQGRITFYNDAAAALWGHRPPLGSSRWCGSWRLYHPDGQPLAHAECPMAVTLREGVAVRGVEAIAERPDGTRVRFMPYPTPLRDTAGQVTGAVNLLIDLSDRDAAEIDFERLAAIVSSSDDAIIGKLLDGRVTSWNAGATRIFGYTAEEMIGQSILRIIPPDLRHEEATILASLARGERIEHFDTVRVAKDGRQVDISLTISPIRDRFGTIVGASKVARDISERRRADDLQQLLFDELNHRVKNTLATIQAIAGQSLRRATSPERFVASFNGRVQALARAHDLLVQRRMKGAEMAELVREQVVLGAVDGTRVSYSGPRVLLEARAAVQLALVLHELATNARKHGGLRGPTGRLSIVWQLRLGATRELSIEWTESGVGDLCAPTARGFGTTLIERSLEANDGEAVMRYTSDGLSCRITLPLPGVEDTAGPTRAAAREEELPRPADRPADLRGTRVLVIEDEPLIALEIESMLADAGCEVVGPAATPERARRLIAEETFDAALVDANLGGKPVDDLAAALTRKGTRFAFATGYGRESLPRSFHEAPMLGKPFSAEQLVAMVKLLVADDGAERLRPARGPETA